jgi:hypothetical protein
MKSVCTVHCIAMILTICSITTNTWSLSCLPLPSNTLVSYDSAAGIAHVKVCDNLTTVRTCSTTVFSESQLLDTLAARYAIYKSLFIGYVDSVIQSTQCPEGTVCTRRIASEVMYISNKKSLKGDVPSQLCYNTPAINLMWGGSSQSLIGCTFIGFYNDFDSVLNRGAGAVVNLCSGRAGFFVEKGRIVQYGWNKLPFVSITEEQFYTRLENDKVAIDERINQRRSKSSPSDRASVHARPSHTAQCWSIDGKMANRISIKAGSFRVLISQDHRVIVANKTRQQ